MANQHKNNSSSGWRNTRQQPPQEPIGTQPMEHELKQLEQQKLLLRITSMEAKWKEIVEEQATSNNAIIEIKKVLTNMPTKIFNSLVDHVEEQKNTKPIDYAIQSYVSQQLKQMEEQIMNKVNPNYNSRDQISIKNEPYNKYNKEAYKPAYNTQIQDNTSLSDSQDSGQYQQPGSKVTKSQSQRLDQSQSNIEMTDKTYINEQIHIVRKSLQDKMERYERQLSAIQTQVQQSQSSKDDSKYSDILGKMDRQMDGIQQKITQLMKDQQIQLESELKKLEKQVTEQYNYTANYLEDRIEDRITDKIQNCKQEIHKDLKQQCLIENNSKQQKYENQEFLKMKNIVTKLEQENISQQAVANNTQNKLSDVLEQIKEQKKEINQIKVQFKLSIDSKLSVHDFENHMKTTKLECSQSQSTIQLNSSDIVKSNEIDDKVQRQTIRIQTSEGILKSLQNQLLGQQSSINELLNSFTDLSLQLHTEISTLQKHDKCRTNLDEFMKEIQSLIKIHQYNSDYKVETIQKQLQIQQSSVNQIEDAIGNIKLALHETVHPQQSQPNIFDSLNQFKEQIQQLLDIQGKELSSIQQSVKCQMDSLFKELTNLKNSLEVKQNQSSQNMQNQSGNIVQDLQQCDKKIKDQAQQQKALRLIDRLYDLSCRKRAIPEEFKAFVGCKQDYQGLLKEYDAKEQFQQLLATTILDGFRRIRGDGNCFYTSFVFQYLLLILNNKENQMFDKFMNDVKTMRFEIIYEEGFSIPQADENYLKEEFMHRLQILRNSDNKEADLEKAFSTDQDIFYGLAIIYLRNLVYQLYQQDQHSQALYESISVNFHQVVITWESQCDQNEVVIDLLARHLGLEISVYYIQNQTCSKTSYGKESKNKILLILQPGHYQIGIEYIPQRRQ